MAHPSTPHALGGRLRTLASSRLGRGLLGGLVAAVVLLASGVVVRSARARAFSIPAYRLGPSALEYTGLHPQLGPLLERSLCDPRWVCFSTSVFDPRAEDVIREAVARHPMVAAVRTVEILYPQRALVRIAVREPAAWYQVRSQRGRRGYLLVSGDARLLDGRCYAHYLRRQRVPLPIVRGVRAQPPRIAGQAWGDIPEQVAEGLSAARVAARLYRDFNGTLQVQTIDVAAFPAPPHRRRDGEVRLHLHDGTVVEWGRTERAVTGVAGEDSYETKRWRLETELARRGPHRMGRIDVRFRLEDEGRPPALRP